MAWDATIVHTCAPSHLNGTAVVAASAAASAESKKESKYSELTGQGIDLRPFEAETLGPLGPSALVLVEAVADRIHKRTGNAGARVRILRKIAAVIQSGNAARILEAHGGVTLCSSQRYRQPLVGPVRAVVSNSTTNSTTNS